MSVEIERKFLLASEDWRASAGIGQRMRQGYLSSEPARTVRVRTIGPRGYLTVKGTTKGVSRLEFEYDIPFSDAEQMLDSLCERPLVEKTRYRLSLGAHTWEIDEFYADNAGLVVAELELASPDEAFVRPPWLGEEVSHDPRYFNSALSRHPFSEWSRSAS